jgi:hypothetical protein
MKIKLYISILIGAMLVSCTEKFDVSLVDGKSNRFVVEGPITNEYKIHKVILSRTGSYFLNGPTKRETGAQVSITDGDTIISLIDSVNGIYQTSKLLAGKPGKTYTLNIKLKTGEIYSASEYMKPIVPMDSIKAIYSKSEIPFDDSYNYNINVFVQEPATKDDFYQWELYLNEKHISDTIRTKSFVNDEIVNGSYIRNWTVYQVPEYKIESDTILVRLQMLSISKAKFDFYNAVLLETDWSGSGFSGPPANVPSNISNGALGFFSVSDVCESRTVIYKRKGKNTNKLETLNKHLADE